MTQALESHWRNCSSCKKEIKYLANHYVCSVSTCTRKRTGYVFCTVHCWERHLPGARHRDAAAVEAKAPSLEAWKRELAEEGLPAESSSPQNTPTVAEARIPNRVIVRSQPGAAPAKPVAATPQEVLIIASRLKTYIRDRSDMNTSDSVMDLLSEKVRRLCDDAIDEARADGRKTVMDRDFKR